MEKAIYEGSIPSIRSNADLGHVPPVDVTSLSSEYFAFYPQSNIKEENVPIQFAIGASASHVYDFEKSFVHMRMKIFNVNNTPLADADLVAPNHDFFASLFSGVEIQLNGYPVSSSGNMYSFRHHISNLLSYGTGYKSTILSEQLYYPDDKQDTFTKTGNLGFKTRHELVAASKEFEVIGYINEAIFKQQRYIPGFVNMLLTLRRNDPSFSLVHADGTKSYKIVMNEVIFYLKRHVLSPEVIAYHKNLLSGSKRFQYPMRQSLTRAFVIAKGSQTHLSEVLFRSKLPEFCVLTFVKTSAYIGKINESPFNFQDFKVSSIQFSVDGDKTVYSHLDFNSSENLCLMGYHTLSTALPNCFADHGISRSDYLNGNFAVCIPLMPNNHGNRYQLERTGQLSVELKFHEALEDSVTCIVMGVFATKMEIDGQGMIYYDQP